MNFWSILFQGIWFETVLVSNWKGTPQTASVAPLSCDVRNCGFHISNGLKGAFYASSRVTNHSCWPWRPDWLIQPEWRVLPGNNYFSVLFLTYRWRLQLVCGKMCKLFLLPVRWLISRKFSFSFTIIRNVWNPPQWKLKQLKHQNSLIYLKFQSAVGTDGRPANLTTPMPLLLECPDSSSEPKVRF